MRNILILLALVACVSCKKNSKEKKSSGAFIDKLKPAPVNGGFKMDDYWVWGGKPVQGKNGKYHLFVSRWPKNYSFFNGYIFYSEVVRAVADTPIGPFEFAEVVLPNRGDQYWDGKMTHNPTIHQYGDKYLLFYIGSSYFGEGPSPESLENPLSDDMALFKDSVYQNIRIGMAIADQPEGPWKRLDEPVLQPRPGYWDDNVTTNPAPCILDDGSIMLIYRSNTPNGTRLGVAKADSLGKPFKRLRDEHLEFFAEDPYVWYQNNKFHMLAKDQGGNLTGERHAGIHAISEDGIDWQLAKNPKAYSRSITWDNGETVEMANFERPQLFFEEGIPAYLYAATADGPGGNDTISGFHLARNTWNMVVPIEH